MHVLDASSIIYAWDNYPSQQFPRLWVWLDVEVKSRNLVIPAVALDEVVHKSPDCGQWLKDRPIERLHTDNRVIQMALQIKGLLGISGDRYHPKGVDENDIFIIAAAKIHGGVLVTNEGRQFGKQPDGAKRKIPAVCEMPGVKVDHLNFIEFIQRSQKVF